MTKEVNEMTKREKIMYATNDIVRHAINYERYNYASFATDMLKIAFNDKNVESFDDMERVVIDYVFHDAADDDLEIAREYASNYIEELKDYMDIMFKD